MRERIERGRMQHGERQAVFVPSPTREPADSVEFAAQAEDLFGVRVEDVGVGYERDGTVYPAFAEAPGGARRVLYSMLEV